MIVFAVNAVFFTLAAHGWSRVGMLNRFIGTCMAILAVGNAALAIEGWRLGI